MNAALAEYLLSLGMEPSPSNGFIKAWRAGQIVLGQAQNYEVSIDLTTP